MTDNPDAAGATGFALPEHRILALAGRDAVAFAQAQLMNDVAALGDGQWQWNGWLTPKGRVVALFALLRLDAETLWLLLPDADPHALAAQLQRFVFRSKVALSVRDDLQATGAFAAPDMARGAQFAGDPASGLELDMGGDDGARALRIGTKAAFRDGAALTRWTAFDLAHGLPRLRPSEADRWTPQQLSLDRLRAYSVKKGCYPGQEIVARTHFLGQAKRGLVLFELHDGVEAGAEVMQDGRVIGSLVGVAQGPPALGLAVVALERREDVVTVDGVETRVRELQTGLAR